MPADLSRAHRRPPTPPGRPRAPPFGTRLYVEGYGYAIAADTGSAIKGMKIDLCHPTHERALKEGRKKVKVYLLD